MKKYAIDFNPEFTKEWWKKCLADSNKMTLWLQKLQRTELSGYTDHMKFIEANHLEKREIQILTNIAHDELKHSNLLIAMFDGRGILAQPNGEDSVYWATVLEKATTFNDYCAANYYGEALASFRFEVIQSMPETPSDIREVLRMVLPDEVFHRETLGRLCGEAALEKYGKIHEAAVSLIKVK
jgi:hypothetical protein